MYVGDFALGATFDVKFCTVDTTGAPTALSSGAVAAYPDNSTTEVTAGITLSASLDSRTGMNNVRVVASSGNGYATATNYALVLTAGTVGGTSVVGYVIGHFSVENRSALRPTTAGRTLDVSAGGEAGVDWANVGSPTTTVGLSGTTVKTATDVETDTQDIQSRLPAALSGGNIKADVIAVSGDTAAADNLEAATDGTGYNVGGGSVVAASVTASVTAGTVSDKTGYSLSAGGIQAIWDALTSALTAATSIGKLLVDNLNATISSRLASASYTAPLDASGVRSAVGLASANLDTQLGDLPTNAELETALDGHEGPNLPTGTVVDDAGNSATVFVTDRTETDDAYWSDALIVLTSGAMAGQVKKITAYNGTTKAVTVSGGFTGEPAAGVTFLLINR